MIPAFPQEITADWLSARLPADVLQGARVTSLAAAAMGVGEGFAGALARIEVVTDPPRNVGPFVAKFASDHGSTRDLLVGSGGYEKEVNFYRDLAARVGVPTPACYVAEYDRDTGDFLLIFEDLSPAANGNQVVGATLAEAEQVIDAMAELHGGWWNRPELLAHSWLLPPPEFGLLMERLVGDGMSAIHEGWDHRKPQLVKLVEKAGRLLPGLLARFGEGPPPRPFTLIHGDVRLDNLFFPTERGGRFSIIDWQGAAVGAATNDLGYWMVLSLPVDLRRRHEGDLLRRYHAGLLRKGVRGYSFRRLQRDYHNSAILLLGGAPILVGNLDFRSPRGQALVEAAAERLDAAMMDWNAARLLAILPWLLRSLAVREAIGRSFNRIRGRPTS